MAITTISRYAFTDDTGDGESGDVLNAALIGASIYDKIDALIAGNITTGGTFRTGYSVDASTYSQSNDNLVSGSTGESLGIGSSTSLTNLNFYANDGGAITQRRATIQATRIGTSNRGGRLGFFTKPDSSSGVDVSQAAYFEYDQGFVVGSPAGGSKGAGAINAQAVYDDNVLLTDWVLELAFRGDSALPHAGILYSIEETERVARAECRLPWMPRADVFERERHAGGMITRLVQGQEQQQLYLFDLARRLAALEAR